MSARNPKTMRRLLLASAATGLLAAAIAGCGSSSATDDTTTTTTHARSTTTVTRTATRTAPASRSTTATGATTGSSTTTTTASSASGGHCRAADLALAYLGGQGATGHGELSFALRNTSGAACRTFGYPGVLFLDAGGGSLPTTPTHTTDDFFGHTAERAVTIAPGGEASFRLGVSHVGSGGSESGCTTAHGLQVIPPDDTATLRVTIPGGAAECGGRVTVSPLQPGRTAVSG